MSEARGWPRIRLSRVVADVVDGPFGSNLASQHYTDHGARVIRLGNIGAATFKNDPQAFISLEHFASLKRHEVRPGDLLVAGLGDEQNALGRACTAPESLGPAIVKADCFRFRLHSHVDHRFAMWFLNSPIAAADIELESRGATRMRATPSAISAISMPLPQLDDQQRIVGFLNDQVGRIDRAIALGRRQLRLTDQASMSQMTSALLGKDETSQIPIRWLGARVTTGPFGTVLAASEYVDGGVPIINPSHIKDGRLHPSNNETVPRHVADRLQRHRLRSGDLVVSRKGDIGRSALVNEEADGWICGSDSIAIELGAARIRPRFLQALLRLPVIREQLLQRSVGATMPSLNEDNLLGLRIPDVSQDEQESREEAAFRLDEQNLRLRGLLSARELLLQERKQALITAAVTGQFDVTTARAVA
jgi:type I restriction enzyme S subunit